MIRVVLDTNVLVSGLLAPLGNEALSLLALHQGLLQPCFSEAILEEYRAVLARPKFGFPEEEVAALMALLLQVGTPMHPGTSTLSSPDPSDSKFLHCAEASQADFLVTGNKRHFPAETYGSTRIVSAGELLEKVAQEI